jgi:hypothetical protein
LSALNAENLAKVFVIVAWEMGRVGGPCDGGLVRSFFAEIWCSSNNQATGVFGRDASAIDSAHQGLVIGVFAQGVFLSMQVV